MIRLRHANGYETYYLHLSAISKQVRPGAHVTQGRVIGRVGASGVVTGPHLDYRLSHDGTFLDPLVAQRELPPVYPVPPAAMTSFLAERDRARTALDDQLAQPDGLLAAAATDRRDGDEQ
jgi:murein DD-endopeptidase MepM/ murein hydrolase activator NlpD